MIFLLAQLAAAAAVVFLALGSYEDLKTGEIPEKISYGFIVSVVLISVLASFFSGNLEPFMDTLVSGIGFFVFGYMLFCLGQWGGGDVKLVTGVGCVLGYMAHAGALQEGFFPYYLSYFLNLVAVAFPYAAVYGLVIGSKSPETGKEFRRYLGDLKTKALIAASFIPMVLALYFDMLGLAVLYVLVPVMTLTALYLKAVELKALQETVSAEKLKPGDVVAEDLFYEGRRLASKRDIEGMTEKDVAEIKRLAKEGGIPREIRIKRGIFFVPVIFFAFLSVVFFGSFVEILIKAL